MVFHILLFVIIPNGPNVLDSVMVLERDTDVLTLLLLINQFVYLLKLIVICLLVLNSETENAQTVIVLRADVPQPPLEDLWCTLRQGGSAICTLTGVDV